jgi:hypothetical protein
MKIAIGVGIAALLGVVVYAMWRAQQTPTVTPTGTDLPPVIEPATGTAAPRARASTRDVAAAAMATSTKSGGTSGHQN